MRRALATAVMLLASGCDAPPVDAEVAEVEELAAPPPPARPVAPAPFVPLARPIERPPMPPVQPPPAPRPAGGHEGGWNQAGIAWRTFDVATAEAARTHKPIMLVLYTTWCPHCSNFSHVFDDATVTAAARDFVMVRADADAERELSQRYAPDGTYIPRTYFLSSNGELAADIKAQEGRFQYFYNERDPAPLLANMRRARTTLR